MKKNETVGRENSWPEKNGVNDEIMCLFLFASFLSVAANGYRRIPGYR